MESKGLTHCRRVLMARIEHEAQSLGMPVTIKRLYEHPVTLHEHFRIDFQNEVVGLEFSKKEIAFLEDFQCQIDTRIKEALQVLLSGASGSQDSPGL